MKDTKKRYVVTVSEWGLSLGIRIPTKLARKLELRNKDDVEIMLTKNGFEVVKLRQNERHDNYTI